MRHDMVWWYERKPNGESMIHKKAHYMGADAKKKGKKEKGKKKEIKGGWLRKKGGERKTANI